MALSCSCLAAKAIRDTDSPEDVRVKQMAVPTFVFLIAACMFGFLMGEKAKIRNTVALAEALATVLCACCLALLHTRIKPVLVVERFIFASIGCVLLADLRNAAQLGVRFWSVAVILLDLGLSCNTSRLSLRTVVVVIIVYLMLERFEAAYRFGLYELSTFSTEKGAQDTEVCDCADPPCSRGILTTMSGFVLTAFVFLTDYMVTRRFVQATRAEQRRMQVCIQTAERVAVLLSRYETDSGRALLKGDDAMLLPQDMLDAYKGLLRNLDQYKPFLPQSVLPLTEDDITLDEEDTTAESPIGGGDGAVAPAELLSIDVPTVRQAFPLERGDSMTASRRSRSEKPVLVDASRTTVLPSPSGASQTAGSQVGSLARSDTGSAVDTGTDRSSLVVLPRTGIGIKNRQEHATLMLVSMRCTWSQQGAASGSAMSECAMKFAPVVLDAVQREGGVPLSVHVWETSLRITSTWNVHKRCVAGPRNAAVAGLQMHASLTRSPLPYPNEYSVAMSSGALEHGNAGNAATRAPIVFGEPLRNAGALSSVAFQIRAQVVCDAQMYARVRSEVVARAVDAVAPLDAPESEIVMFEVLSMRGGLVSEEYLSGFSALRQGRYEDAEVSFRDAPESDGQCRRLQHVSAILGRRTCEPYLRRELRTRWDDIEHSETDAPQSDPPSPSRRAMIASMEEEPPDDGAMLKQQLDDLLLGPDTPIAVSDHASWASQDPPSLFRDQKGRRFHRSSKQLGKGAFGEVWLGMAADGGMVAVKSISTAKTTAMTHGSLTFSVHASSWITTLSSERDTRVSICLPAEDQARLKQQIADMVQEVTLMTSLRHENIVQYLGCAIHSRFVLIVMEYIPGGSLMSLMSQFGGSLPASCVQRFAGDMLRGLVFIHKNGIVHRDLKPANVLVSAEGRAHLADFGASAQLAAALSEGRVAGTPLYMAPEQARGAAETASDVWAFGLTVVELVTGRCPWPPGSEPLVHLYALASNVDFVPDVSGVTPAKVREMAVECLVRDPSKRPSTKMLQTHPFFLANFE